MLQTYPRPGYSPTYSAPTYSAPTYASAEARALCDPLVKYVLAQREQGVVVLTTSERDMASALWSSALRLRVLERDEQERVRIRVDRMFEEWE